MKDGHERLPPQNIEAEQSVLGAMLIEKEALLTGAELLRSQDFYKDSHRLIFSSLLLLAEKGDAVDLVTLSEELRRQKVLEEVGGAVYLTTLANATPTAAHIEYHARIVKEKAILRNLIQAATQIVTKSYSSELEAEQMLDEAEQMIFEVASSKSRQGFIPLKDVLSDTFQQIEKLYERKSGVTGLPTGFSDFDNLTSGLQVADLVIIAARPSMGKTTLALNMAQFIAINEKQPVAFFSLEMSKEQLAQRLLCAHAEIDAHRLRRGYLSSEDWPKLTRSVEPLSQAPIFIDDTAAISVMEMRAKARRLKMEQGLSAIFVDYLQLMQGSARAENRQQEISAISRSLKALAKELSCPVVALSQLSRAVEQRNDKRPMLSDLLESGGIEANADLVSFIYRDDYYNPDTDRPHVTEVIISKQRNGPTGKIELYFMDSFNKFLNLAPEHRES